MTKRTPDMDEAAQRALERATAQAQWQLEQALHRIKRRERKARLSEARELAYRARAAKRNNADAWRNETD